MLKRQLQILMLAAVTGAALYGQFTSGSTGADGAYSPTVSGDFEIGSLDPDGDNVFNFTTINIPAGVTIRLRGSKLRNRAVTWLASGAVTIAGTLSLDGATPATINTNDGNAAIAAARIPPDPGPGGYTGGLGARGGVAAEAGAGPGGGPAGTGTTLFGCDGGSGSFSYPGITHSSGLLAGPTYGSYLAIPLYGGSGGGGGSQGTSATFVGGVGGSGGGAIRIISDGVTTVTGVIRSNGGGTGSVVGTLAGCPGGSGAGGTIHLVAATIAGNGTLQVNSGFHPNFGNGASTGLIRFSTSNDNFYTLSAAERDNAVMRYGYTALELAGYVWTAPRG